MRLLTKKQLGTAKTRKTLKAVDAAPDWFRLENYKFMWDLDAAGWAEQLTIRSMFALVVGDTCKKTEECKARKAKRVVGYELHWKDMPESRAFLSTIEKCPHLNRESLPWFASERNLTHCIRHLTMEDPYLLEADWDEVRFHYRNIFDEIAEAFPFNYPPEDDSDWNRTSYKRLKCLKERKRRHLLSLPDMTCPGTGVPFRFGYERSLSSAARPLEEWTFQIPIMVDLTLPDDMLVKYFSRFLKEMRSRVGYCGSDSESHQKGRKAGLTDIASLANSALLPYLDLSLWSFLNNTTFSNELLGKLIFERQRGSDSVRKNAAHYAVQLMDPESDM